MPRTDPHSYFDDAQPRAEHAHLTWRVDFASSTIAGAVTLRLSEPAAGAMDLDTRDLDIEAVTAGPGDDNPGTNDAAIPWDLAPARSGDLGAVLGRRLRVELPPATRTVTIRYRTTPASTALQWLEPAQTEAGQHPFLFSQCQPIHARALVPLQDSPCARIAYDAEVTVPAPLAAVMSAGPAGESEDPATGTRTFAFTMPQPIPPYLMAIAVGAIESRDLSPRSRIWAEPPMVERAAWEFSGVEDMLETAESLFGPYEWERFDMLVLPPSFPYGGMENPRMTFLTPTIIAGDRSLADVVSHELAHSWTGNLVTNANAEHFWLNEGFTVWADRRIQEALHGEEKAALDWVIGGHGLAESLGRFGPGSPMTKLRTDLAGQDPDMAYSVVPYEKGARLLVLMERAAGRARWDVFMRKYMAHFRFQAITTEEFMAFLETELPGVAAKVDADRWLFGTDLPDNAPEFRSATIDRLSVLAKGFADGTRPAAADVASWSSLEILIYLQDLPRPLPAADCAWLDKTFKLAGRENHEILVEWLTIAAASDYEPAFAELRKVLGRVGRMKYLRPLFVAMGGSERTRALAREIFATSAPRYHVTARRVVESVMAGWK